MTAIERSNKKLGAGIVAEAEKKHAKAKGDHAIGLVQELIKMKEHCVWWAETNQMAADFYQRKLDAVASGKFSLSPATGAITFHEQELNEPVFRRKDQPKQGLYIEVRDNPLVK